MRSSLKLKVGLALGGGAARGLAHIGVLRVLEREQVPIDLVAGTSMGAIIGGAWVATGSIDEVERRCAALFTSEAFSKNRVNFLRETKRERGGLFFSVANLVRKGIFYGVSTVRTSFLSAEQFAADLASVIPHEEIESLRIPFGAVALDLAAAREVLIRHGDLRRAAEASSAIPGILPPVEINGRPLIDGGWVDKLPVLPAFKMGADVVIAVDISADLEGAGGLARGVDIMVRANAIKDSALTGHLRRLADLVIEPDIRTVHWADFGAFERCIAAGEAAAEAALPTIRQVVRQERVLSVLRPRARKRLAEIHLQSEDYALSVE